MTPIINLKRLHNYYVHEKKQRERSFPLQYDLSIPIIKLMKDMTLTPYCSPETLLTLFHNGLPCIEKRDDTTVHTALDNLKTYSNQLHLVHSSDIKTTPVRLDLTDAIALCVQAIDTFYSTAPLRGA